MRVAINGFHAASVLGGAALLTTALTAVALAWPSSAPSWFLGLAPSHEARAATWVAAPNPTTADLAFSQRETIQSLRQAPANPTAWLRLAYIDSRGPAGLGGVGIDALQKSYAAAPYGPDDTGWRLRFVFNHWGELDQSTRLLALEELRVALANNSPAVRELAQDVSDPAGHLAVRLTSDDAERVRRQAAGADRG